MKKQNWFCKLVSRLCNRNKEINLPFVNYPCTVQIPYDEVKKYIHKVNVEFNVHGNNENDIKYELSNSIADYLIKNDLISYSVINSELFANITINRVRCNFVILTNKNTENENPQSSQTTT